MNCYVCNESVNGSYSVVRTYWASDHSAVYEKAAGLDTGIGFYENEGRIYMIRNLLSRTYKPIGVLVLRLNPEHCFGSLMRRQELMADYSLRIGDISEMVGFLDVAHFSRVFKNVEGISANEYRNTKK